MKRKGSLLVEALLSVVILSVSITLIVQSMTAGLKATQFSQEATLAVHALDNDLTRLRLNHSPGSKDDVLSRLFTVEEKRSSDGDLTVVDVAVRWTAQSRPKTFKISTYEYPFSKSK